MSALHVLPSGASNILTPPSSIVTSSSPSSHRPVPQLKDISFQFDLFNLHLDSGRSLLSKLQKTVRPACITGSASRPRLTTRSRSLALARFDHRGAALLCPGSSHRLTLLPSTLRALPYPRAKAPPRTSQWRRTRLSWPTVWLVTPLMAPSPSRWRQQET